MRCILYLCVLTTLLVFLPGCAVVSISQHQTAELLGEGNVRITTAVGLGRDLAEGTIYEAGTDEEGEGGDYTVPLFEAGIGIGITEKLDLGGMFWASLGSGGVRTYAKFALPSSSQTTHYAFVPGLVYQNSDGERTIFDSTDKYNYRLLGLEIPILFSYRASRAVSLYGSGRVHVYNLSIEDPIYTDGRESFFIAMPGLTGGIQIRGAGIDITPEVAVFYIYDRIKESGSLRLFPNFGLSFRF
jgi:hypothetical protein